MLKSLVVARITVKEFTPGKKSHTVKLIEATSLGVIRDTYYFQAPALVDGIVEGNVVEVDLSQYKVEERPYQSDTMTAPIMLKWLR